MSDNLSSFHEKLEELKASYLEKLDAESEIIVDMAKQIRQNEKMDCLPELVAALHKIAGSAGIFGFEELSEATRRFEINLSVFQEQTIISKILVKTIEEGIESFKLSVKNCKPNSDIALTQVQKLASFEKRLAEEISRAERYKRNLCLMALNIKSQEGETEKDVEALERLLVTSLRKSDHVALISENHHAVILPESTSEMSIALYHNLCRNMNEEPKLFASVVSYAKGYDANKMMKLAIASLDELLEQNEGTITIV